MNNTEKIIEDNYFPSIGISEQKIKSKESNFMISPLKKGFGLTVAELLTNTINLFSSGWAVISICVYSKEKYFDQIPGTAEETDEILLSLGHIVLSSVSQKDVFGEIFVTKPGIYCLKDVIFDENSDVIVYSDLDIPLFTMKKLDDVFTVRLRCREGVRSSHIEEIPENELFTYAKYSPVKRTEYNISSCLYGTKADYDQADITIKSSINILPKELVEYGIDTLIDQFSFLVDEDRFG